MREVISHTCNRFSETDSEKCISYLAANNLHDWAMSQYLPYGKFKF